MEALLQIAYILADWAETCTEYPRKPEYICYKSYLWVVLIVQSEKLTLKCLLQQQNMLVFGL